MQMGLRVEGISKRFGGIAALDGVSLEARPGQITSVIGQNGAGKTTLLNAITQLPPPDSGRVFVGDFELTGLPAHAIPAYGIARTFQQLRILTRMTALDNVLLGFQHNIGEALSSLFARPRAARAQETANVRKARTILAELDLASVENEEAGNLSYGLQKLLSLARVIATDAKILMLDEPTSGLGSDHIGRILDTIKRLRDLGRTIVLVEHDMDVVFDLSDRIIVLDHGKLFAQGAPKEIRANTDVRAIYFGSRVM
jgi:branched-chain amino acid transport system ATP-binding protein